MGIFSSSSKSSGSVSSSSLNLISRFVYAESRGEPYKGQVAVAAVILNRVKDSRWQINLSPNDTARKAAQDAMNGWDPTYGAIYYFNPNTATSKWIWSRPMTVTIGKHRFCK